MKTLHICLLLLILFLNKSGGNGYTANSKATTVVSKLADQLQDSENLFNRVVWLYWHKGNLPKIGQFAKRTWQELNPNWEVRVVGDKDLDNLIELSDLVLIRKVKTLANRCDLIRLYLLKQYGGVYADADTFGVLPLDSWLFEYMSEGTALYVRLPTDKYDRPISSWFIASYPESYVVTVHYNALLEHVRKRPSHQFANYLECHYLFKELLITDKVFQESWDAMPVLWGAYKSPLVDAAVNLNGTYSMGIVCCLSGQSPDSLMLVSMRRNFSQLHDLNNDVVAMIKSKEVPVIKSTRHHNEYPKSMKAFMSLCSNILKNVKECLLFV